MSSTDPECDSEFLNSRHPSPSERKLQIPTSDNEELSSEGSRAATPIPDTGSKPSSNDSGNSDQGAVLDVDTAMTSRLITPVRDDYYDPSTHDLTGDRHDPDDEPSGSRKRLLFCFHCNRSETHSPADRFGLTYSFLVGLTIGLIKLIGPFYCRCCGHRRYLNSDRLHPKYQLLQRQLNQKRRRLR